MSSRVSMMLAVTSAFAVTLSSAQGAGAQAQPRPAPPSAGAIQVQAEVIIVHGLETPGAMDPAVAQEPVLRGPAFQQFQSMRILGRPTLTLQPNRLAEVQLPNGRKLQLTLVERKPDGRCRVRISIPRYLPSATIELSPGAPFFQAGQAFQGGRLVIALRVR